MSEETRISYIDGGEIAAAAARAAGAAAAEATYAPLRCSADTRDKPAITSVVTAAAAPLPSEPPRPHMMMMMAE